MIMTDLSVSLFLFSNTQMWRSVECAICKATGLPFILVVVVFRFFLSSTCTNQTRDNEEKEAESRPYRVTSVLTSFSTNGFSISKHYNLVLYEVTLICRKKPEKRAL